MSALSDWNDLGIEISAKRRQGSPLLYFLGFVMLLFIGILIFCYVVTKQTNPIFLDEHGKPVAASSEHAHR